jgi:hypothetical protein
MTITGFFIAALIVFALFALWYYFVNRTGTYNAADGSDDRAIANMRGNGRPRPTASPGFLSETGEIGRPDDNQRAARSFEPKGENRANRDDNGQNPVKTARSSAQIFQSEIGTMGDTAQQPQAAQGTPAGQNNAVKTAKSSAQVFQQEIGSIGAGQSAAQSQEPPAHCAARKELVQNGPQVQAPSAAQAHQKYTVEAGEIGELGRRFNLSADPQLQPPGATLPSPDSSQVTEDQQKQQ